MGNRQKPGETPNRPGEYEERGPRGGHGPNPRKVTIKEGDKPPTSDLGEGPHLGADRPAQAVSSPPPVGPGRSFGCSQPEGRVSGKHDKHVQRH